MNLEEDLKTPFISNELIEYLERITTTTILLYTTRDKLADERIGFMLGSKWIVEHLKSLRDEQEEKAKEG